jgi:hypothetical protein
MSLHHTTMKTEVMVEHLDKWFSKDWREEKAKAMVSK